MISKASPGLANCDGYDVYAEGRPLGRVEEIWLGPWDAPTAVVVRLVDRRRGLLLSSDVAGVWPTSRFLTLAATGRLLQLEPPHLEPEGDGARQLAASWRTSGDVLEIGERPGRLGELLPEGLGRSSAQEAREDERPLWQSVAGLYVGVAAIAGFLTGLDILVSYLVTGSPPY